MENDVRLNMATFGDVMPADPRGLFVPKTIAFAGKTRTKEVRALTFPP